VGGAHAAAVRVGALGDGFVGTALVGAYAACGRVGDARRVFDEMPIKNAVSWNALVGAHGASGDLQGAERVSLATPARNISWWNNEITRNVRLGDMAEAARIFREMPERDAVSWKSMIGGYAKLGMYDRALDVFSRNAGEWCGTNRADGCVSAWGLCRDGRARAREANPQFP